MILAKKIFTDFRFWLMTILASLALFFSYPAEIRNAISQLPAAGYEVHVSVWRIIFEPLFGPLIFLMRSPEPFKLYSTLFLWFVLIVTVRHFYTLGLQKRSLLQWFKAWPLYITMFITILLVVIFAPLPSDTIINHHPETILINVHSHSYYSHDGLISQKGQVDWHRYQGFDAFFLTDHNHHQKTLDAVAAQRAGRMADKPLILPGQEYSGSNHLLLLGLKRAFNPKNFPDKTAIDSCHRQQGVAIIAHWFTPSRNTRSLSYYIDAGADGFEVVNQAEGAFQADSRAQKVIDTCRTANLVMVSACDYHGYGNVCQSWTSLTIPGWHSMNDVAQQESVLEIFRNHQQEKINVLILHDRPFEKITGWFRPLSFTLHYGRTLNLWQVLSWFFWTFLQSLLKKYKQKAAFLFSLSGSIFILVMGIYMAGMALQLKGYNNIFQENSRYFIGMGIPLLLYTLWFFRKKIKIFFAK